MCDDTLGYRRERMAHRTEVRQIEKELEASDKVISSLQKKLAEKYQKKAIAYQSILDLKKVYDGEVFISCNILKTTEILVPNTLIDRVFLTLVAHGIVFLF